jgi:hypothetical protein
MVKLFDIHDNVAEMTNYVAQMSQLLVIQDNQHTIPVCMPNSNGAGTDTPEQNMHDTGSELFEVASSGNVSMSPALLSVTGTQSYINYTDGLGRTSLFKSASNGNIPTVAHLMVSHCSIHDVTSTLQWLTDRNRSWLRSEKDTPILCHISLLHVVRSTLHRWMERRHSSLLQNMVTFLS